jgi:acyl-coenzyme A thioesterase PaaI-like protein
MTNEGDDAHRDDAHLDPLVHVAQPDHPDAIAEARARAGRSIRDIGHALVGHHAPTTVLERLADTLDGLTAELEQGGPRWRAQVSTDGRWGEPPADGEEMTTYDERPVSGRASPWGLDLTVRRDGDEAVAVTTLRAAHEGAPGRSHGGIVAALFDDVFGFVLHLHGQPAFTGELTVRYQAGVPIGVPLECRVRLSERDGRKWRMTGELTAGGQVLATSRATFITIDRDAFAAGAPPA